MAATTKNVKTELSATDRKALVIATAALLRSPKASGTLSLRISDSIADSGGALAVISAGVSAMADNIGISYSSARERQLMRSAERVVALAEELTP